MLKLKAFSRLMSVILLFTLIATALPVTALAASDSGRYYTTYRTLQHEWQNSTDEIDVKFADNWTQDWVDWFCNTGKRRPTFTEKVEATFNAAVEYAEFNYSAYQKNVRYNGRTKRVEELPKAEMAQYLPHYRFSDVFNQAISYVNDNYRSRSLPAWTEIDYAKFMTGLLRLQDIPAYIEVGTRRSLDRYTYRVAVVDTANNRIYYCDPARAILSGNTSKWMWLSEDEYTDDFRYSHVYKENPKDDPASMTDYTTTNITIPAENRFDGIQVPIRNNSGRVTDRIYMRIVFYNGDAYFWYRDIARMLQGTVGEIWVKHDGTLQFGLGTYKSSSAEVNWTEGKSIAIDKKAQAYLLSHAYYEGERVAMNVIVINGDIYVRPDDITDEIGIYDLDINVNIDWK